MAEEKKTGGRPWGEIRPVNAEAGRLARFLRARVDESGKSLRDLAAEVGYSASVLSGYLGGKIPPEPLVIALVKVTVPDLFHERRRQEALDLLTAALNPPRRAAAGAAGGSGVTVAGALATLNAEQAKHLETYAQLTQALAWHEEIRQSAANSHKLVWVLFAMVGKLQERVSELTGDRDRLEAARSDGQAAAERKLARAVSQQEHAEEKLRQAQAKQRQAEELSARLQDRIDAMNAALQPQNPASDTVVPAQHHQAGTPAAGVDDDPDGDDIDAALQRIDTVMDTQTDTIGRVADELTHTPPPPGTPPAEHPSPVWDNPPTRQNNPNIPTQPANGLTPRAAADNPPMGMENPDAQNTPGAAPHLDPDHPDTLQRRHEHALQTGKAGDHTTTRDLFRALIDDRIRVLGPDHPDTLETRHNHAYATSRAGDHTTARNLYRALIDDLTRVLGPDHPNTLETRHSYAYETGQAGGHATARDRYRALIDDRIRVLGPDHPNTLETRQRHAYETGKAGDHATARDRYRALIDDLTRVLGTDHPDTLETRHNHAAAASQAGDHAAARDLYRALIYDLTRVLGTDHPIALRARHNHVIATAQAGDRGTARLLLLRLIADHVRVGGSKHPYVADGQRLYESWLEA